MIPLKLELKNFLSYGPLQTIDFQPYSLICLCGKNGHGKSALLDAITWAVWGQARKIASVAKPDAQLLRLGQTHMMVNFHFEFNGQHYKIRREFSKNHGKPHATLDFGIVHEEGRIISLTDKTIKATQYLIEHTLGLTYESFINSAFLRQGQSNEFSKKSPKERKEILSVILGLEKYESLRKIALNKMRTIQNQIAALLLNQETIKQDSAQYPHLKAEFTALEQKLHTLDQEFITLNDIKKRLYEEKTALDQQRQKMTTLELYKDQKVHEKKVLEERLLNLISQWRLIHRQLLHQQQTTTLEQAYHAVKARIMQHQTTLNEHLKLKNIFLSLKEKEQQLFYTLQRSYQTILEQHKSEKLALESETKINQATLKQNQHLLNDYHQQMQELNKNCQAIELSIKQAASLEHQSIVLEKKFEKRKAFYHTWQAQANHLHQELKQLNQKRDWCLVENPSCPLCEQNLSAARKKFLKTKFDKQQQSLTHQFNRLNRILKLLKEQLIYDHKEKESYQKELEHKKNALNRLHELQTAHNKINLLGQELQSNLKIVSHEINALEKKIAAKHLEITKLIDQEQSFIEGDEHYLLIKKEIEITEQKLRTFSYDEQQYQADLALMQKIENQIQEGRRREQERLLQQRRMDDIQLLFTQMKCIKKELQSFDNQLKEFSGLQENLRAYEAKEHNWHEQYNKTQSTKEQLLQEQARLQQALLTMNLLEKRHQDQEKQLVFLNQEVNDYHIIIHALSKDGIQGLFIEQIIPEIEHEANRLLSQLTDNQAHIFIEPLRDLQKGGTKETLDIKISDSIGIRPYELFSGGEAFRIDFALRIAISKLLARRAGTSLQTLIIDEGFGSQDEEGLHNLMEAIYKIQDNFCKIIIVSHLPSMKDQFPVHFMVEKGSQGSSVHIIEQG